MRATPGETQHLVTQLRSMTLNCILDRIAVMPKIAILNASTLEARGKLTETVHALHVVFKGGARADAPASS